MISQVGKRYKGFKLTWKGAINLIGFTVLAYFINSALNQLKTTHYFPIKDVKIVGVQHVAHEEVEHLLIPLVNKGFFAVNVDHIKESLAQFPWVADASVRRIWPNEIVIQVTEKNPLARWNNAKLLSTNGQLFAPPITSIPTDLPEFIGPEGEQLQVMQNYEQINAVLLPLHLKIARIVLTADNAWSLMLDNGIKLNVGHKDSLTRVGDFVKVYPKIIGDHAHDVDYVDLRYANGLAVRWKTVT